MKLVPVLLAVLLPLQAAATCEKRGIYLECSNLNVDELLSQYTNEQTLKLTNVTGISSWNSSAFSPVNTLIINTIQLNTESFRALVQMPHLSSLEMTDVEDLKTITTADFPFGSNLRRLKIKHCDQCKIVLSLPSLSEIDLSQNNFKFEPIVKGKSLLFVNVSSTGFKNMFSLPNVQELDVSHNQLVTPLFEGFHKVEKLWLNHNNLREFHASFPNLMILDLSENQFETIGNNTFEEMPQLTTVYLSGNRISSMVEPFNSNKLLKILDLSRNQLKGLDAKWFEHIKELEVLKLSQNVIETLPDLTVLLANLHHLDLSSNQLVSLNAQFFQQIPELAFLDVSDNKLTNIDQVTPFLGNLNRLLISRNSLVIGESTFAPLQMLNYLEASENGLQVTLSVFGKNSALKHLYLNSNRITNLCDGKSAPVDIDYLFLKDNQIKSLRCLSKVRYLDVDNNPLDCNEELKNKLIELADSIEVLLPATSLVEVFNRSQLELVDGNAMFQKLCPNGSVSTSSSSTTMRTTTAELVVHETEPGVEVHDPASPMIVDVETKSDSVDSYESYQEEEDSKEEMGDYSQSQKESIFDVDNNLQFNYHGRRLNGLAAFCLILSVALGVVLCVILIVFVYQKIRTRREANLGSDRPYKPLKNEVYKSTTAGIENNNRNIAQVFSKFKNDKFDEIMIKFGFKWNGAGDVESEARMIPA